MINLYRDICTVKVSVSSSDVAGYFRTEGSEITWEIQEKLYIITSAHQRN